MESKNTAEKNVLTYIITFVLMLTIISISLLGFGKYSMLSVRAVVHDCDRVGYYGGIKTELKQEAYDMGIPYGITKKCLKNVFREEEIRGNISSNLRAQVNGEEYGVSTKKIEKRIRKNVEKNFGDLSDDQEESLDQYISEVTSMYKSKMVLPGSTYIAKAIVICTKATVIGIPLSLLIGMLCVLYLISSNRYIFIGMRHVTYGVLGAGAAMLIAFGALISSSYVYKYNISDVYMRQFFTFFTGHEMLMQMIAGGVLLAVGIVLIYFTSVMRKREMKKR